MDNIIALIKDCQVIVFSHLISTIDEKYDYQVSSFNNGNLVNQVGENVGSAKVFSFAKIHNLNQKQTLFCFGEHYQNVLANPELCNHQNIRNFIKTGWQGISFDKQVLIKK